MRPLQVWLPSLGHSIGFPQVVRDARRAQAEWDRHDTMYLLPELHGPERWRQKVAAAWMRVGAIPADHQDCLSIFHVGANGWVFSPYYPRSLHGSPISDLLNAWLNLELQRISIVPAMPIEVAIPDVVQGRIARDDSRIRFEVQRLQVHRGAAFPMEVVSKSDDAIAVEFRWPPKDDGPSSVHPDAESTEATAPAIAADLNGVPGALVAESGEWHPYLLFLWPAPFDRLLGPLAGFDAFQALADMRAIAVEDDRPAALGRAQTLAADYLSEGHSTLGLTTFWPTALQVHRPGEPIRAFWEPLGISARTFEEAMVSDVLARRVPVVRAWGGLGLLWALLIARLEGELPIRTCLRCGYFLGGRRRVCGKGDSPKCFKTRRAEDQRRSRS